MAAGSRLDRALAFWEERYARVLPGEGDAAGQDEAGLPATPAERRWLAERLLLQLWRDPGPAVRRLHRLFRGGLQETIGEALALHTAADAGDSGRIRLPWSWAARPATEQVLLAEMGFGGGRLPRPGLRQPGRVGLALGIGLGLVVGGLGAAVLAGWQGHKERPVLLRDATWPADAAERVEDTLDAATPRPPAGSRSPVWGVTVATRSSRAATTAAGGSEVRASWEQRKGRCVQTLGAAEIWRCGRAVPPSPSPGSTTCWSSSSRRLRAPICRTSPSTCSTAARPRP